MSDSDEVNSGGSLRHKAAFILIDVSVFKWVTALSMKMLNTFSVGLMAYFNKKWLIVETHSKEINHVSIYSGNCFLIILKAVFF